MTAIKNALKIGLLMLAGIALFYVLTFVTQLTLTTWDGALDWPAVGTWQRALNDFFAADPGRLIISIPVILVTIALTVFILRRHPDALNRLVILNWLFIPTTILVWLAAVTINNNWIYPYPPVQYDPTYRGFHLVILPITAMVVTYLLWLGYQLRLAKASALMVFEV